MVNIETETNRHRGWHPTTEHAHREYPYGNIHRVQLQAVSRQQEKTVQQWRVERPVQALKCECVGPSLYAIVEMWRAYLTFTPFLRPVKKHYFWADSSDGVSISAWHPADHMLTDVFAVLLVNLTDRALTQWGVGARGQTPRCPGLSDVPVLSDCCCVYIHVATGTLQGCWRHPGLWTRRDW